MLKSNPCIITRCKEMRFHLLFLLNASWNENFLNALIHQWFYCEWFIHLCFGSFFFFFTLPFSVNLYLNLSSAEITDLSNHCLIKLFFYIQPQFCIQICCHPIKNHRPSEPIPCPMCFNPIDVTEENICYNFYSNFKNQIMFCFFWFL